MKDKTIIYSLHRPFHKPLVSVKWVCQYMGKMEKRKKEVIPSSFYSDFFFYFIDILNKKYNKRKSTDELEGIPPQETIKEVLSHFSGYSHKKKAVFLKNILINRESDIDRKVYSTYKATSYYINLAKDKFELIDKNYKLCVCGKQLASSRSPFFSLSKTEQGIIFERILHADFYMIIPLCLSLKSIKRYKWDIPSIHLHFIEKVYNINHFKYTQASITKNYDNVRLYWLDSLNVLDKNMNIRKRHLDIILNNNTYKERYSDVQQDFIRFETDFLIFQNQKIGFNSKLENSYNSIIKKGLHDQNFVNLYDIKKDFRLSFANFESMLNSYYESQRKKRLILFSNTVTNIDKRKRFYVRNKPVIKIKIF